MTTAQDLARKCLPTAHPAIRDYVKELEEEIRALRKQLLCRVADGFFNEDRLIEAANRALELEQEYNVETEDWPEASGTRWSNIWPSAEAKAEIEKRIDRIQTGLAAAVRKGPNPDPEMPF